MAMLSAEDTTIKKVCCSDVVTLRLLIPYTLKLAIISALLLKILVDVGMTVGVAVLLQEQESADMIPVCLRNGDDRTRIVEAFPVVGTSKDVEVA